MSIIDWILVYLACGLITFLILTAWDRTRNNLPEASDGFYQGLFLAVALWPICLGVVFLPDVGGFLLKERRLGK